MFGFGEKKAEGSDQQAQQTQGVGFITEAVIEGIVLASGGAPTAIAAMLVAHSLGHDPAIWIYLQKKFGNEKTGEIKKQVDSNGKAPPERAPETKPEAAKPDYKAFCASFQTAFAKCLSAFPGGMTEELVPQYFTATQITDLNSYMESKVVPPNLFHQASGPKLTAQHRICMSGVILANGTLPDDLQSTDNKSRDVHKDKFGKVTDEKDNKLHATMCGHWAQQVYLYAGAGIAAQNKQALGTVDSGGTLHLGNAQTEKSPFGLHADTTGLPLEGKQKEAAEAQEAREAKEKAEAEAQGKEYKPKNHMSFFRHAEMGEEVFTTLQPGDWIYIYNANADATGEHSEVFIGWADEVQTAKDDPELKFRTANVMSQMNPTDGGKTHQQKISTKYAPGYAPVTSVQRVTQNAGELTDVNSLVASDAVTKNEKTIADKKIDAAKLRTYVKAQGAAELQKLMTKKLAKNQADMFQAALNSASDDAQGLAVLIACVQRMDLASGNLFAARTANGYIDGTMLKDLAQFKAS